MQGTNNRKPTPYAAASKKRKFVNSSVSSSSPAGVSSCGSQKSANPSVNSRKNLKDGVSPIKPASPFKNKSGSRDFQGENVVLVHQVQEDYAGYLKQKLISVKRGGSSSGKKGKDPEIGPRYSKAKCNGFSSKAMRDYVMDIMNPFSAEQIITATTGQRTERRTKFNSPNVKSGASPKLSGTVAGRHVARTVQNSFEPTSTSMKLSTSQKSSDHITKEETRTKEIRSCYDLNMNTVTPNDSIRSRAGIEESKTALPVSSSKAKIDLGGKSYQQHSKLRCKCKKDALLPCCVKAANWIKTMYRSGFDFELYKKLYEVWFCVTTLYRTL